MPSKLAKPTGAPLSLAFSQVLMKAMTIKPMISAGTPISARRNNEGMAGFRFW